jgi:hypothetical protein
LCHLTTILGKRRPIADIEHKPTARTVDGKREAAGMRLRDQFIVSIAVVFATIAVGVNVFAQNRAGEQRAENERVAIEATWAQPMVPTTTIAPTTSSKPVPAPSVAEPSTIGTRAPGTTVPADGGVSTAPGRNKEDCIPPGQVDRDEDKKTPPGQDRDMCVPPGQDKDKDTPPGQVDRDEDKTAPPGQDKDTNTPPGQDKDKGKGDKDD